jgi:hypothetical protein
MQASLVPGLVAATRARIAECWHRALSDHDVLVLGLACAVPEPVAQAVVELHACAPLARAVLAKREHVGFNDDEVRSVLALFASKLLAPPVADTAELGALLADLAGALRCTLAESSNRRVWDASRATQLGLLVGFLHSPTVPQPLLEHVFDSLMRADARRLDDFVFAVHDAPPTTVLALDLLQCVAHGLLA